MDKIGSLLSKHHRQDKNKVEELRSILHSLAAYHTLKECAQQKGVLTEKIQTTNEKIKAKRKQLESLREELRVLGMFTVSTLKVMISLSLSLSLSDSLTHR